MFSGGLFWFAMGAVFVVVVLGARTWADDLALKMTWWKWLLALLWYGLLNFTVALAFTLVGEGEALAGGRFLVFLGVVTVILGAGLARLLVAGRREPSPSG